MKNVQIRDVPDDIHAALTARAESENKSLQTYLSEVLAREAKKQRMVEWLARVESHRIDTGITNEQINRDIDEGWERE